ncbi:MAG: sensor histidine kinase [Enterocloster bolteae]
MIFNSFTQEGRKKSESQKGTGLGMAISYMLMKQMHGDIRVESRLGSGSTFTIEFLRSSQTEASSMEEAEQPAC